MEQSMQENQDVRQEADVQKPSPTVEKNKKMFFWGIGGALLLVILVAFGVGTYRVYAYGSQDRFSTTVAKILRLPIVRVNGTSVSYSEYVSDMQALKLMIAYDSAKNKQTPTLTNEQISDQVLLRLAGNIVLKDTANKYGVLVEDKDRQDLKTQMLKQFSSESEEQQEISKRYGWDMKTFEEKIMVPYILQNKTSKKLAEDVLDQIKKGASFEEMAKKYGEDGTSAQGGDLGWFAKGQIPPEVETVAFSLKKGELSSELVQSEYGYHILKVNEKRVEKIKNAKGKLVPTEQVKAQHILFLFPGMERYVNEQLEQASVKMFGKVHDPFNK